jgi:hypothetical protein
MSSISTVMTNKSDATGALLWVWRLSLALLVTLVLGLAWLVAAGNLFKPGSELGYNLGLAGGLLMLSLLLYPLRKRVRALDRLGQMESWFRYHMFIGIASPVIILFHSTFRIGSMNGRIALYAMLLVMLSGLVGRFIYRHVHRGMYGKEITLTELDAELKARQQNISSVLALRPDFERRLQEFHRFACAEPDSMAQRIWRFMTLHHKGKRLAHRMAREAQKARASEGLGEQTIRILPGQIAPSPQQYERRSAERLIRDYVYAVVRLAQLSGWAKLLSLWHVAHVPFIYLLVFSGIAHVVAVHLY